MTPDFIVLGLPRSGTTWLANWLTTDRTLCLHDPFQRALPEVWDAGGKRLGVSCTGAYLLPGWLESQSCPVAIVERDPVECDASLARMGLGSTWPLRAAFRRAKGRRFQNIWDEANARELWEYLLPGIPFDAARYRLLRGFNVQPQDWTPDMEVMREAVKRYMDKESPECLGAQ